MGKGEMKTKHVKDEEIYYNTPFLKSRRRQRRREELTLRDGIISFESGEVL